MPGGDALGSGRRGFVLRAWRRRGSAEDQPVQAPCEAHVDGDENEEGTAEVKDGRIVVHGPTGSGAPATIVPCTGVVVQVNGKELLEPCAVTGDDTIVVVEGPAQEVAPPGVEITVSPDRLRAEVKVFPRRLVEPCLRDQAPQTTLHLAVDTREIVENVVTPEDVQAALNREGIVLGVDRAAVEAAAASADGLPRVVANGVPPVEGRDGFVECLVELEPVPVVWSEEADKVNYWERYHFPAVHAGDELAVLHPPIPGTPGRAVTGETIHPRQVREGALRAGEGAVLSENGTKALAARDGKPVVRGTLEKHIEVSPVMVYQGDVGLASGHVRFDGDVVVRGDVLEGARIEVTGSVTVLGYAAGAVIQAGGAVKIKGSAVNCRIRAGGVLGLCGRLRPVLETIGGIVGFVEAVIQAQMVSGPGGAPPEARRETEGLADVVRLKMRELDKLARSVRALVREAAVEIPPEIADAVSSLARVAGSLSGSGTMELPTVGDLRELGSHVSTVSGWVESAPASEIGIVLGYAQNSVLESGGDILITGKGCYNCSLTATEGIRVKGNVRGGETYAVKRVQAGSVGTPGQLPCSSAIRVSASGQVRAGVVYPGTTIQVGAQLFMFDSTRLDVRAHLDDQGDLVIR